MIFYRAAVASSPGKGKNFNEDNFFFNSKMITEELAGSQILLSHKKDQKGTQIYAIMDGAGSDSYQNNASLIAAERLRDYHNAIVEAEQSSEGVKDSDFIRYIDSYVKNTDKSVKTRVKELLGQRISTTLALLCVRGNKLIACNVGDTRIYRFRNDRLEQITKDDTQAQRMIDKGVSTPDKIRYSPRKNKLTQYLGVLPEGEKLEPHYSEIEAEHADLYLICTSSFSYAISDERICELIKGKKSPVEAVDALMSEAVDSNVREDVTIMAIQAKDSAMFVVGGDMAVPAAAAGMSRTARKKESLYSKNEEETKRGETAGEADEPAEENEPEKKENKNNPWLVPLIIGGCILLLLLLLLFGIKTYKNSRPQPTIAPIKTPYIEEEDQTPVPATQIPTATPSSTPGRTPTPTPGSSDDPSETPEQSTPSPTPTATPSGSDVPLEGIIINTTNAELGIGGTTQIKVSFIPENATDKSLSWKSSDETVATVDNNGNVTAIKEGTVNITVTPSTGASKTVVVSVVAVRPEKVEFEQNEIEAVEGEAIDLKFTVTPETAYYDKAEWTSSDETVAAVDENGKVTVLKAGTATITLTLTDGTEAPKTAECTINAAAVVHAESVALSEHELELEVGETFTLSAIVSPSGATNTKVTWSTDLDAFVSVDENGKLTAHAVGAAIITVTTEDGGYTDHCSVVVVDSHPPTSITLDIDTTEIKVVAGYSEELNATVLPSETKNKNLIWTSSNEAVVTVESGRLTGVSEGAAVVRVTSEADETVFAECTVTVIPFVELEEITLSASEITMSVGETKKCPTATFTPEGATFTELEWTVEGSAVVVENGFIDAVAAGTAVITAKAPNGLTASVNVTVTE